MARRDSASFVGRAAELSVVDALLLDDPAASVVLVHGPGGLGKSALLREVARRGQRTGWTPFVVDGQDLPPCPDALDEALARARRATRPLVLVDSYERMSALGPDLRRILPTLPDRTVVVVAGRAAPEPAWFEGGWEWLVRELPLGPLSPPDARALLATHGATDGERAEELTRWAGGSPLVLTLAVQADRTQARAAGGRGSEAVVARAVGRRLIEREDGNRHPDVVWVASLVRTVTEALMTDVLPSGATDALRWLASRTYARQRGARVELDDLARWAVRCELVDSNPDRYRDLVRRLADCLYDQAMSSGAAVVPDLAELVLPASGPGGAIDSVRPGDTDQIVGPTARALLELAPELGAVARDQDGRVAGYSISVTSATAPQAAHDDPVLGPWLQHAATLTPDGNALLCRDLVGDAGTRLLANVLGRSGTANPRYVYLPTPDVRLGPPCYLPELGCHLLDCGETGLVGRLRDRAYGQLGLRPCARPTPPPAEQARATAGTAAEAGQGPALELRVLTPVVEVLVGGEARALSDAQAKLLLALAASHPTPMHAEQVSELLWPNEPLEATRPRLHNLLLRLRKALDDRSAVTARRGGVLGLAADRWTVDLWACRQVLADKDGDREVRRRALLRPSGNLAEVQFPYDDHFVEGRARVRSEWLRHARAAGDSGEVTAADLAPVLAALGLTPADL
jgi:hypothetical protein